MVGCNTHLDIVNFFLKKFRHQEIVIIRASRPREGRIGANWEKIARFEKLKNSSSVSQNGLAFMGLTGKASLSEFPKIYDKAIAKHDKLFAILFIIFRHRHFESFFEVRSNLIVV